MTPNRNSASLQFCVGTVIIVTKVGEQHPPWQYCKIMTADVFIWWFFLCAVSGLNILAWALSAQALERRQAALPEAVYRARRLQLFLSAGYVFGCAFRSILPVYDVPRVCLFDSWLCSVMVGRSVATFAEVCFAAQWALMMREISHASGSFFARIAALALVPLIIIAETFSWYSVLTTSNLGHVVEESIWGASAALVVISLIAVLPRCAGMLRRLILSACAAGTAYVCYMFLIDVPMYWSRWVADEANRRDYLGITQGLADVSQRWIVSHHWQDWQSEIAWMSLYFSVAVWLSIALIYAPILERRTASNRTSVIFARVAGNMVR